MKKAENSWIHFVLAGTILIIVYKFFEGSGELKSLLTSFFYALFPCILGLIIAFILYLPAKNLELQLKKNKIKYVSSKARGISVFVIYFLIVVFLVLLSTYILPKAYKSIEELVKAGPKYIERIDNYLSCNKYLSKISAYGYLEKRFEGFVSNLKINEYLSVAKGFAEYFVSVFAGIIISLYILLDRDIMAGYAKRLCHNIFKGRLNKIAFYGRKSIVLFYSYFSGLALDSFIVAAVSYIGFMFIKIPYGILLSIIVGIGNMIPIFGAVASTLAAAVIGFVSGGIWRAVSTVIFLFALYIADGYFLQPKIVSKSIGIRPLLVLVSVVVFGNLFGFLGMVLGVPIAATLKMILESYSEEKRKE